MSSDADKKSPLADPLLILIALLLVVAAAATLYFIPAGASKSYAIEPGARPRPVITNTVVILNVQEIVAAPASGHAPAVAIHAPEVAPPKAETPAAKPAEPAPAAVSVNPPAVTATTDGRIHGRVMLKGTPPPERPIAAVKADGNCGRVAHGTATTRNYVVGADGGLRYALARIVKAPAGAGTKPGPVLVDQLGCMYEPYISAIPAGGTVQFRNSDPFMHNINASPKVAGNKPFNISQATAGTVNDKSFDQPELSVRFVCNVHPWMIGFVHVLENPFFAVTNENGDFELPAGMPPGKYELEIIHPKGGTAKQEIEVAATKGANVVFELPVGAGN